MRLAADGLRSPHPMSDLLPALLAEDPLAVVLADLGDAMLAPVMSTLDNLDSYLDLRYAPPDLTRWLGWWVGASFERARWRARRRSRADDPLLGADLRADLATTVDRYTRTGVAAHLAQHIEELTGLVVTVEENGASDWTLDPDAPLPGRRELLLIVRVEGDASDAARVERALPQVVPAYLPYSTIPVRAARTDHA